MLLQQKVDEIVAIDERDWDAVAALSLFPRALGKVAGGDNAPLVVGAERATDLLDGRGLNIVLPPLGLHGKIDLQSTACTGDFAEYIDPSIARETGADDIRET